MLDHQAFYNHHTVYQEVVHVPLVLRLPDGRAAGRRVSDRVRLLDLYPTLVELAGLSNEGVLLHGRSLVPLLEGRSLSAAPALSVGGMFDQASIELGGWKLVETIPSVRSGQESLLSSPWARAWLEQRFPELAGRIAGAHPRREFFVAFQRAGLDVDQVIDELLADIGKPWYELYYLPDDPREERDLSAEHPERVAQLSALLDERRARAIAAHLEPGQVARPRARTADELRELSELGYVDEE
jgi:arylsulfatase A-like enzyme